MSLKLSMDFKFTTTIEKLWSALTDSSKLARWVVNIHNVQAMENDFKPVEGHRFQLRAKPFKGWDGIIEGEVIGCIPCAAGRRLSNLLRRVNLDEQRQKESQIGSLFSQAQTVEGRIRAAERDRP